VVIVSWPSLAKVLLVCSFQILVRWSLPRFRYDPPLRFAEVHVSALINLTVTAVPGWALGAPGVQP
jgi:NADH-quinone oxidoreductase subunit H